MTVKIALAIGIDMVLMVVATTAMRLHARMIRNVADEIERRGRA